MIAMMSDSANVAAALAEAIDRDLRERGSADRAEKEKAYLKSELDHYGVSVPETRAVVRATLSGQGLNHDEIIELARSLWVPSRTAIDLPRATRDRKSTRLNSSHVAISYAVFCLKKKNRHTNV